MARTAFADDVNAVPIVVVSQYGGKQFVVSTEGNGRKSYSLGLGLVQASVDSFNGFSELS